MKKTIVVIVAVLMLGVWGQAWATDYYVDSATGDNGDNGTTQALAWATIEKAMESGGLAAGDKVWVRRGHSETATSHIEPVYAGTATAQIAVIGWPRPAIPNTTITQGDWTNGSATVDNIVGITCDREDHNGRWATGPDGNHYLITQVVDANTIKIDREYAGSTVTGASGLFQIEADEDFATRPSDVASWDGDAHTLPRIDLDGAFYIYIYTGDHYWSFRNLEIEAGTTFITYHRGGINPEFIGCLLSGSANTSIMYLHSNGTNAHLKRRIVTGSGSGSSQHCVDPYIGSSWTIVDSAIYNCGGRGISNTSGNPKLFLSNVNVGVEIANGGNDIISASENAYGIDVKDGGKNLSYATLNRTYKPTIAIENYNKVLGAHKSWYQGGTVTKQTVVAGSATGDEPYKRTGGASAVMDIAPSVDQRWWSQDYGYILFTHTYTSDGTSKTYRYYAQADALTTSATELWLEAEYVSAYDDTTEYVMSTIRSDEALTQRSGADDWDEYLEVTVDPAVASTVRIFLKINKYDADGHIYVDPMVEIN